MRVIVLTVFIGLSALNARCQTLIKGIGPQGIFFHYEGPLNAGEVQLFREGIPVCTLTTNLTNRDLEKKLREAEGKLPLYPIISDIDLERIEASVATCKNTEQLFMKFFVTVKEALGLVYVEDKKHTSSNYKAYLDGKEIPVITDSSAGKISEVFIRPAGSKSWYGHIETSWKIPEDSPILFTRLFRKSLQQADYTIIPDAGFRILDADEGMRIVAQDTSLPSLSWFNYKLVGLDFYGNPSPLSESIQADNLDNSTLPLALSFKAESDAENQKVLVSWKLKFGQRVKSLILERSASLNGSYEKVADLSPFDSTFTDAAANPMEATYYKLKIYDLKGLLDHTPVTPVINRIRPEAFPPAVVSVELAGNYPSISWNTIGNNIRGYRVFRTNVIGNEPEEISGLIQCDSLEKYKFTDSTLLQKGLSYHYSVRTESRGYVLSNYSDFVSVYLPNEFIETPLGLITRRMNSNSVFLSWNTSKTNTGGVYAVYRRTKDIEWKKLTEIPLFNTNYYVDENASDFTDWEYYVVGLNEFNQEGKPCAPFMCKASGAIEGLPLICRLIEGGIEISWPEMPGSNYLIVIEQANENGEIINSKEFPVLPSKTIWTAGEFTNLSFRARLKNSDGQTGQAGEWVSISK